MARDSRNGQRSAQRDPADQRQPQRRALRRPDTEGRMPPSQRSVDGPPRGIDGPPTEAQTAHPGERRGPPIPREAQRASPRGAAKEPHPEGHRRPREKKKNRERTVWTRRNGRGAAGNVGGSEMEVCATGAGAVSGTGRVGSMPLAGAEGPTSTETSWQIRSAESIAMTGIQVAGGQDEGTAVWYLNSTIVYIFDGGCHIQK